MKVATDLLALPSFIRFGRASRSPARDRAQDFFYSRGCREQTINSQLICENICTQMSSFKRTLRRQNYKMFFFVYLKRISHLSIKNIEYVYIL